MQTSWAYSTSTVSKTQLLKRARTPKSGRLKKKGSSLTKQQSCWSTTRGKKRNRYKLCRQSMRRHSKEGRNLKLNWTLRSTLLGRRRSHCGRGKKRWKISASLLSKELSRSSKMRSKMRRRLGKQQKLLAKPWKVLSTMKTSKVMKTMKLVRNMARSLERISAMNRVKTWTMSLAKTSQTIHHLPDGLIKKVINKVYSRFICTNSSSFLTAFAINWHRLVSEVLWSASGPWSRLCNSRFFQLVRWALSIIVPTGHGIRGWLVLPWVNRDV